jgi:pimeloyl-ACP methyl ester carboxylesterase
MQLYTRVPRDPDMARRAVNRPEVLQWFTQPGGESHRFNMLADLGRIQCPTLVLGGEDDPIHPIESQADIAAALPAHLVRFERFANCRHAVVPDAAGTRDGRHARFYHAAKMKPAPEGAGIRTSLRGPYEFAFRTVTARRFCDQHEMSLQTATGRSLP